MPGFDPIVTRLVEVDFETLGAKFSFPLHLHPLHQLDVILAGNVTIKTDAPKNITARKGDGLLIPPLVRHGYQSSKGFRLCSFRFEMGAQFWPLGGTELCKAKISEPLVHLIDTLSSAQSPKDSLNDQCALSLAGLCATEALRGRTTAPKKQTNNAVESFRTKLFALLANIHQAPFDEWTVTRMAQHCHLSTDHFSKQFRKIVQFSPREYLLTVKLEAAARTLLKDPSSSISDCAEQAGYCDLQTFSRVFKRKMGVSPSSYRRLSHFL